MLGQYNAFEFDEKSAWLKEHPSTTREILTLCDDLKVLSKYDFRQLLKWRMKISTEMKKEEKKNKTQVELDEEAKLEKQEKKELTEEEKLTEELHERLLRLKADKKRKKRKVLEKKRKFQHKIDTKQIIPGDTIEVEDSDLFSISQFKSNEDLDAIETAEPDIVLTREEIEEDKVTEKTKREMLLEQTELEPDENDEDAYNRILESYLDNMYGMYKEKKGLDIKELKRKKKVRVRDENLTLDDLPGGIQDKKKKKRRKGK